MGRGLEQDLVRSSFAEKKPGFSEKAGFLSVEKCSQTCDRVLIGKQPYLLQGLCQCFLLSV